MTYARRMLYNRSLILNVIHRYWHVEIDFVGCGLDCKFPSSNFANSVSQSLLVQDFKVETSDLFAGRDVVVYLYLCLYGVSFG